jgi:hypothetical protein
MEKREWAPLSKACLFLPQGGITDIDLKPIKELAVAELARRAAGARAES